MVGCQRNWEEGRQGNFDWDCKNKTNIETKSAVTHAYKPSTWKLRHEAGGYKFEVTPGYIASPRPVWVTE